MTPKLIPLTSEITECDLKPGLRVRHRDGRECVLVKHSDYWAIYHDGIAIGREHYGGGTLHSVSEILHFLRSDFTPIEPQYRTVGDVPPGVWFATNNVRAAKMLRNNPTHIRIFLDEDNCEYAGRSTATTKSPASTDALFGRSER